MIRNIIIFSIAVIAVLEPVVAYASPSVRVVRMQSLLENSIAGKAARASLEQELQKGKAELERGRLQLKKMAEDLQSQGMLLSESAIETKQEKLRETEIDLKRKAKDLHDGMQRKTAKSVESIVKEVQDIIQELADEEDFDFIFQDDTRFVVYASDEIDITDTVTKILDERKLDL